MTDNMGTIFAQYAYDPYGARETIFESQPSTFTFAGYLSHTRSGLNWTLHRAYSPSLGRWLSRDPLENDFEKRIHVCNIIQKNPVDRLSQIRAWHRIAPRQNVIPDYKMADWYKTVVALNDPKVRDYLLLLLFTGLRRTEAATLGGAMSILKAEF
jgi:RHS repeat-associated core domain